MKKTNQKRFLTSILSAALLFSMNSPAFAAGAVQPEEITVGSSLDSKLQGDLLPSENNDSLSESSFQLNSDNISIDIEGKDLSTEEALTILRSNDVDANFTDLQSDYHFQVQDPFVVVPGITKVNISLTWTPPSETLKAGLKNVSTGNTYVMNFNSPGAKQMETSNLPGGNYYVVVVSPASNTKFVSGSVSARFID